MINETELMRQHGRHVQARLRLGEKFMRAVPSGIERIKAERERKALERPARDVLIVASLTAVEAPTPPPPAAHDEETATILSPFRWKFIIREVCEKHGIKLNEIMSVRRPTKITTARHEAFYRLKNETSMSYPQIGRVMGGFDHTTVLHGVKMHEKRMLKEAGNG